MLIDSYFLDWVLELINYSFLVCYFYYNFLAENYAIFLFLVLFNSRLRSLNGSFLWFLVFYSNKVNLAI